MLLLQKDIHTNNNNNNDSKTFLDITLGMCLKCSSINRFDLLTCACLYVVN